MCHFSIAKTNSLDHFLTSPINNFASIASSPTYILLNTAGCSFSLSLTCLIRFFGGQNGAKGIHI